MKSIHLSLDVAIIDRWFRQQRFRITEFKAEKAFVSTYWGGKQIVYKLIKREGFTTYYKEGHYGSLIVFEVSGAANTISYEGYCPIWLFGIWVIRRSFKEQTSWWQKYRMEGYGIERKFQEFLHLDR